MKIDLMNELGHEVYEKLWLLKDVPLRDPKIKASQRAQYLAQIKQLPARQNSFSLSAYWPFSTFKKVPATGRVKTSSSWYMPFGKVCTAVVLVLVFAFASLGVTAYAAQSSLPTSPIYAFKLITEDLRLHLTLNEEIKFDLALDYADKRVEEIAALQFQGVTVQEPVISRLQQQYELALEIASEMPDDQMSQSLEQLQETTRIQLTTMTALVENLPVGSGDQLGRAKQVLTQQQSMAQDGLDDPTAFRQIISNRYRHGAAGNGNLIGFYDEPGPSNTSLDGQVQIPPKGKGPGHGLGEPVPAPAPPAEEEEAEDAPGAKGEAEPEDPGAGSDPGDPGEKPDPGDPGEMPGPGDPGETPEPGDPGNGPGPGDPGKGPGPGDPGNGPGSGRPGKGAGFMQNNSVETQGFLFSNSTGLTAQFGLVKYSDRYERRGTKFSGSADFVP